MNTKYSSDVGAEAVPASTGAKKEEGWLDILGIGGCWEIILVLCPGSRVIILFETFS